MQEVLSTGQPASSTPEVSNVPLFTNDGNFERVQVAAPTNSAPPEVKPTPSANVLPEEVEFEFSDLVKLACLLCARQFKSLDQLKKHNKESNLHKVSQTLFLVYDRH